MTMGWAEHLTDEAKRLSLPDFEAWLESYPWGRKDWGVVRQWWRQRLEEVSAGFRKPYAMSAKVVETFYTEVLAAS